MAIGRTGGKLPGAGRKPTLSPTKRLEIGGEVERRIEQAALARLHAKIEARNDRFNLREKRARLNSIPVAERLRRRSINPNWADDDDTVLDIRDNLTALYASSKVEVSAHQLRYGLRSKIIAAVARKWSKRMRRKIATRLVERCLEDYRMNERRLKTSTITD